MIWIGRHNSADFAASVLFNYCAEPVPLTRQLQERHVPWTKGRLRIPRIPHAYLGMRDFQQGSHGHRPLRIPRIPLCMLTRIEKIFTEKKNKIYTYAYKEKEVREVCEGQ